MIDGDNILTRFSSINMQFDMAMRAIDGFKDNQAAVDKYVSEELESLRKLLTEAPSKNFEPDKHWAFSPEGSEKYLQSTKDGLHSRLEDIVNRLRQNKLILLVTLLESFLKDIHREVLRQNPGLLKPDRQIPLGKLVAHSSKDIIDEEIEREVQILDRKSLKERAEYFDKRLNISWFEGTILPLAEPVVTLRNKILHEDPDTKVAEADTDLAALVCLSLPISCVMQAAVLYPNGFKIKNLDRTGMQIIMENQGRLKPNSGMQPTPKGGAAHAKC